MIRRIVEHNRLNGVVFSIVEFLLVAAAAGLIAVGQARQHQYVGLALAAGTALNALVVVAFGVAAWSRGERGSSIRKAFTATGRAEIARAHPRLTVDTLALVVAVLLPYVTASAVLLESARRRSRP